jgi:bifunctional enzyme CysN/CysC
MKKNIRHQKHIIQQSDRCAIKNQHSLCIWLTGLPCSGKTTISNVLEEKLFKEKKHTYLLDGDNIRHGLCQDLSFNLESRSENIRRISEVARLMVDAGLIVIVSTISPMRQDREYARNLFSINQFLEVYLSTPVSVCKNRDLKGHYRKAELGQIKDFTGIDSPYEKPENPDIQLDTSKLSITQAVDAIMKKIASS